MNLKILGTSHIAKQSVEEIQQAIRKWQPDIVAVELDAQRAASLMENQKSKLKLAHINQIGLKGFIFAKLGQFVQQKLGKAVGMDPGSEMKEAILEAKRNKLHIALIDQPIQITLRKFSQQLTWREKGRFISDFFKGIFSGKKQLKNLGIKEMDLKKVPSKEVIKKMMDQLKLRYPSIYKTLVEDRNKYMVKSLIKLLRAHPGKKILAIVGAGHEEGMHKLLLKVEFVR